MALGIYPDVRAKEVRSARDAAKLQKSDGFDPGQVSIPSLRTLSKPQAAPNMHTQRPAPERRQCEKTR